MFTTTDFRRRSVGAAAAAVAAVASVASVTAVAALLCGSAFAQGSGSGSGSGSAETPLFGFGQAVSASELARFYSSLPDGRGLPQGSGTVAEGKAVYQAQCLSCHGENLQGNGLGERLIGGRGTLVNDDPTKPPIKTVESYWPYATTLFDYISRAMPFTAPGSLSHDQAYAVSAYILNRADIVGADARMDARTLAAVRMPNRDGFMPDPRPEQWPPPAAAPHSTKEIAASTRP